MIKSGVSGVWSPKRVNGKIKAGVFEVKTPKEEREQQTGGDVKQTVRMYHVMGNDDDKFARIEDAEVDFIQD